MFAILRVVRASTVLEITLALVYVVEAVLTDDEETREMRKTREMLEIVMAEIIATQYYTFFQAHINEVSSSL